VVNQSTLQRLDQLKADYVKIYFKNIELIEFFLLYLLIFIKITERGFTQVLKIFILIHLFFYRAKSNECYKVNPFQKILLQN